MDPAIKCISKDENDNSDDDSYMNIEHSPTKDKSLDNSEFK